jgi:hypothetical protein
LPNLIVPIWVSEPIGGAMPLRMASTPATNVVATAPMPGIMTPNLPFADAISVGFEEVFSDLGISVRESCFLEV